MAEEGSFLAYMDHFADIRNTDTTRLSHAMHAGKRITKAYERKIFQIGKRREKPIEMRLRLLP